MLRLSLPKEPYWIDLAAGVRVKVRPCTSAVFYQARAFMNQKLQKLGDTYRSAKDTGMDTTDLPNLEDSTIRESIAEHYLIIGLARAGIIHWEGILEADCDEPAPVTDPKIDELFGAYWVIAETFRQQYTGLKELLEAEKNVCGPVSNGTSQAGPIIVKTVPNKNDPVPKADKVTINNIAPTLNMS